MALRHESAGIKNSGDMKVALAQINTTVGDFAGNEAKILAAYQRGVAAGAELVMCPELSVCGYPPRDLLLKRSFLPANWASVQRLAAATGKTGLLIGYAGSHDQRPGREATNSAALLQNGGLFATRHKTLLEAYREHKEVVDAVHRRDKAAAVAALEANTL